MYIFEHYCENTYANESGHGFANTGRQPHLWGRIYKFTKKGERHTHVFTFAGSKTHSLTHSHTHMFVHVHCLWTHIELFTYTYQGNTWNRKPAGPIEWSWHSWAIARTQEYCSRWQRSLCTKHQAMRGPYYAHREGVTSTPFLRMQVPANTNFHQRTSAWLIMATNFHQKTWIQFHASMKKTA